MNDIKRMGNKRHQITAVHGKDTIIVKDHITGRSLVMDAGEALALMHALDSCIDYLANIKEQRNG